MLSVSLNKIFVPSFFLVESSLMIQPTVDAQPVLFHPVSVNMLLLLRRFWFGLFICLFVVALLLLC